MSLFVESSQKCKFIESFYLLTRIKKVAVNIGTEVIVQFLFIPKKQRARQACGAWRKSMEILV
jgi:hypothetical protein